ncbi:hypothetical protein AB9K41_07640 [Cribrihabitans sp. XS_ASV171]
MTDREQFEVLENKLAEAQNLTSALQLVAWDMAQREAQAGSQERLCRDAVIGLADALERVLA